MTGGGVGYASEPVPRWGRWERPFVAGGDAPPGAELVVRFTAPSGRVVVRRGFWDGGDTWRVRVMADEPGEWLYRTTCSPADPGLHDVVGRFTCEALGAADPFHRHGRVTAAGTLLRHADGTPFFYLADTAWNGPLLASDVDWATYLTDRATKRFNAIQFVPAAPWSAARSNAEGEIAYTAHPAFPVNPHSFRRMDRMLDAVNGAGMLAVPVLLWAARFGPATDALNPGVSLTDVQAIALARYLVARYGAHHVLWLLAGDGDYGGAAAERWRRTGRAVFDLADPAPVALHPQGTTWPYDDLVGEPWLTVRGYQSSHLEDDATLRWLQAGPAARAPSGQPLLNFEPCYEGLHCWQTSAPFDARQVRRAVYWSLLNAPTAGVAYGAHGVWSWERSPRVPLNHQGTGVAPPWQQAMGLAGGEQMRHVAELFASLDWPALRPNPNLLATQPGERDRLRYVAAATTPDGRQAICYLPAGGAVAMRAGALRPGGAFEWFDPRTGARTSAGAGQRFVAPTEDDWVLLFRSSGA